MDRAASMLGRALWGCLALAHVTGCILAVPAFEHSEHCEVTGATVCATCLRTKCQTTIDACCNDRTCRGEDGHSAILDGLDQCGAGNARDCGEGLGDAASGSAGDLRACVATTCLTECLGNVPLDVNWSCSSVRNKAENPCAACIYGDTCGPTITECCGDASCSKDSGIADDIGGCLGGDTGRCVYRTTTGSSSGVAGKVRACIVETCSVNCLGDGRPHTTCNLQAGGAYCSCSDSEESTGPRCPGTSVAGECLRGKKGCTCGRYACTESTSSLGGCSCQFHGTSSNSETCDVPRTESGGVCCLKVQDSQVTCECKTYLTECGSDEVTAASCDYVDIKKRLTFVESCSN